MNAQLLRLVADTLGVNADASTAMESTPAWDSVAHLNLCLSIEAEFGVPLTPEEMLELTSVAAIEALLARRRA